VIVAIGLDVDSSFGWFIGEALRARVPLEVVNLRAAIEGAWRFDVPPHGSAMLDYGGRTIELRPDDSYYCRLIDLSAHEADVARAHRWQAFMAALSAWLDAAPGLVMNRSQAGAHNSSKPLHEAVLRELGFCVPESLTTSDARELRQFVRAGPAISKTVCGVRADTVIVTEADIDGFVPRNGPVHVQRLVSGADARIHVVGNHLVAQRVTSEGIDYRRTGDLKHLEVFEPPAVLRELLVEGTQSLGLAFAGWDFKIDGNGAYWCLEANPMPGYGPYDVRCGGAISSGLLTYLGSERNLTGRAPYTLSSPQIGTVFAGSSTKKLEAFKPDPENPKSILRPFVSQSRRSDILSNLASRAAATPPAISAAAIVSLTQHIEKSR